MSFLTYYHKQLFKPDVFSLLLNPFYFSRKGLYDVFKNIIPSLSGSILDFGCGQKPYQYLFENIDKYIGIDIENEGHPHDKENIDIYYQGTSLPLANESYDVVFSSEVFEHVEHLDDIVKELYRILKPGGKMLISVPFVYMEHELPYDFRRFSIIGIKAYLGKNGFTVLESYKTTKDIETVFQVIAFSIYAYYADANKYLKLLLSILFIGPFNIIGFILSFILSNKARFYSNSVVLCQKI